jgi:hypothetical protein
MKKLALALLLVTACKRAEVAEPAAPQAEAPQAPPPVTATTATTAPAAPAVDGPKLAFVDDAAKDPSFAAFRDQLLTAVRARDTKTVFALSDPHIRTSFGGDAGHESLTENHWKALEEILPMGGSFREGMFWAPYVYSAWPEAHDAFESLAVIGDNVPLRESADANATAIATLSRDIVKRAGEPGTWQRVTTADGKTGFVESKLVRSPVDYRAGFLKTDAGWRMNALVAGD